MPSIIRSPQHRALGCAIRERRRRQRISQEELGFRAGLHRNYVGAIERGELNPTYGVLLRLCGGLGVGLAELVGEPCGAGRARPRARPLPVWNGRLRACGRGARGSGNAAPSAEELAHDRSREDDVRSLTF